MKKLASLMFSLVFISLGFAQQQVTINFALKSGDMNVTCGNDVMLGATQAMTQILDARLFIYDVYVVSSAGKFPLRLDQDGKWQYENVALIDFENATGSCTGTPGTNLRVSGEITELEPITAISFTVGIPDNLNHLDAATAPAPLNVTDMWWVWRTGYKFLRIDLENRGAMDMGKTEADSQHDSEAGHGHGAPNAYFIHLGSTGCISADVTVAPDAPCGNSNRIEVMLDNFDPQTNTVVLDLQALLMDVDVSQSLALEPPGCMSGVDDPDCMALFTTGFGLSIENGQQLVSSPAFFRVE